MACRFAKSIAIAASSEARSCDLHGSCTSEVVLVFVLRCLTENVGLILLDCKPNSEPKVSVEQQPGPYWSEKLSDHVSQLGSQLSVRCQKTAWRSLKQVQVATGTTDRLPWIVQLLRLVCKCPLDIKDSLAGNFPAVSGWKPSLCKDVVMAFAVVQPLFSSCRRL